MGNLRDAVRGTREKRPQARLIACMVIVGVLVVFLAVGIYLVYTARTHAVNILERFGAGRGAILPDGYTEQQVYREFERFVGGLVDGTVQPGEGVGILFQLFFDAADGALTRDELRDILKRIEQVQGVYL